MAKTKISGKRKKSEKNSLKEKSSPLSKSKTKKKKTTKKEIVLIEHEAHTSKLMMDSKLVLDVLFDCLKENDLETFRDVLISHIKTVNKAAFSKNAGIGRRTLYEILDTGKDFNPTLSTVAAVISAISSEKKAA